MGRVFHSTELRTIYISGDITAKMASSFARRISLLDSDEPGKEIMIHVNSEGGDMDGGFTIVDAIRATVSPVKTIAVGAAMSAAALILAAGDTRQAYPNSTIMVHQGVFSIKGTYTDLVHAELPLVLAAEKRYSEILADFTKQTVEFWESKWAAHNFYMTPDEAMKLGIIDSVVVWRPRGDKR